MWLPTPTANAILLTAALPSALARRLILKSCVALYINRMASKPTATAHLNKRKNRPDEEGGSSAPIKLARTEEKAAAASAAASTTAPPSQQQQQQQQKSIKQQHQQKVKLKALVGTPYAVQWPSAASAEHQAYIADVLTEQFSDTGRRRRQIELEARLGRHKLSKAVNAAVRQRQRQEAEKGTSTGTSSRKEELEKALKLAKESAPRTAPELKGVVTGINAVTRALEQGKLRLVVVCRDVQPPTLVQHLPVLCTRSDALLVPLSQGSTFLAPLLGMKRVAAFGILVPVSL